MAEIIEHPSLADTYEEFDFEDGIVKFESKNGKPLDGHMIVAWMRHIEFLVFNTKYNR